MNKELLKKLMEKQKVNELRDINVIFVSYVKAGANRKNFLLKKDSNPEEANIERVVKIIKKDAAEKLITGIVYAPWEVDSQDDFMRPEEIVKACNNFNEYYRLIDKDHSCIPGAGHVVQSYTALTDMKIGNEIIKEGTWLLITKATDETWKEVEKEDYNSYSIWGFAKERRECSINEFLEMANISKDGIIKDFSTELSNDENTNIYRYVSILQDAIWKALFSDFSPDEKKNEILKSIDQFKETVSNMTFEVKKTDKKKSETDNENKEDLMEKEQLEALKKEIQESVDTKFNELKTMIESLKIDDKISPLSDAVTKSTETAETKITEITKALEGSNSKIEVLEKEFKNFKTELLESGSNGTDDAEKTKKPVTQSKSYMLGMG